MLIFVSIYKFLAAKLGKEWFKLKFKSVAVMDVWVIPPQDNKRIFIVCIGAINIPPQKKHFLFFANNFS